jgi:chemotaxis protein MotA
LAVLTLKAGGFGSMHSDAMGAIGLVIVLACVAGGFGMAGGHFGVLIQPSEFVVIIGAAAGSLLASAPGKMRSRVFHVVALAFKDATPKTSDYMDMLKLLYELLSFSRRNGLVALEPHVTDPKKSDIFKRYGAVAKVPHAVTFLAEALQQALNGTAPEELEVMLDSELDTVKDGGHLPITLLKTTGDALPGIGIVAAVLGIIVTMGHMDAAPAVIGHHVAAALVGTFLGILLCYGIIQPLANSVELQETHQLRYLMAIKAGLMVSLRGSSPAVAVEFARKMIFIDERPSFADVDKALQSLKSR